MYPLNDEGILIGLENNRSVAINIIVGDFFIYGNDEEGNLTSLSEKKFDTYAKIFFMSFRSLQKKKLKKYQ
nr:DUF3846 domain-containing protein [uncultured Anaerotignum sp.]